MRTSLKGGEDSLVDSALKSTFVLAEEDHTGTGSTKRLVSSSGDNIAVFKRRLLLPGGNQTRDVGHVHHQKSSVGIGDLTELFVVPVARVCGSTSNDQGRLEESCITSKLLIIDVSSLGVDTVWKRFKVNRSSRHSLSGSLLLGVGVESMSQVSTTGQIQAHDTIVWAQESSVDSKVGRRSRIRLDIDAPLFRVQVIGLQGTLLAKFFDLIDDFVTSVVSCMWKTLRIFVGQSGSQAFHDGLGRKVFGRNQFQRTILTRLLLLNQIKEFRIMVLEGDTSFEFQILERSHDCWFYETCDVK
mmetsp:Transcript_21723/g.40545  ORF Transcript_21723/g.40545 Transcript_21723/m.40545 type:complete len:300 (-) Transcript_21723:60-959(-)